MLLGLTDRDGGDLGVDVKHAIAVNVHQEVASALLVVAEEVDGGVILRRTFSISPRFTMHTYAQ